MVYRKGHLLLIYSNHNSTSEELSSLNNLFTLANMKGKIIPDSMFLRLEQLEKMSEKYFFVPEIFGF